MAKNRAPHGQNSGHTLSAALEWRGACQTFRSSRRG